MMQHKGYTGSLISVDGGLLHGEVNGITDVVTFQGSHAEEFEKAFQDSVDEYLAFCESRGEPPEKPFSGRFVLRIPPGLHFQAVAAARAANQSLNSWIKSTIERAVDPMESEFANSKLDAAHQVGSSGADPSPPATR